MAPVERWGANASPGQPWGQLGVPYAQPQGSCLEEAGSACRQERGRWTGIQMAGGALRGWAASLEPSLHLGHLSSDVGGLLGPP